MEISFWTALFVIFSLGLAHAIPVSLFWIWMAKKRKATIRLLAFLIMLVTINIGVIFWFGVRESWILFGAIGLGVVNGLIILASPITSPEIVKKLNIKW